jgi:hypothetical protein
VAEREILASVSQRLLWMIRHYRPEFGALNCPLLCHISGPVDVAHLRRAVDALTVRHESLRTTFSGRGSRLLQHIHPPRSLPLVPIDLSGEPDPAGAARTAVSRELATPIDPHEWPTRVLLWRLGPAEHILCLNVHHLVTDAWSTGLLLRDLCAGYAVARDGVPDLPVDGWQYARFVEWQRDLLTGASLDRYRDYWRRQLAGTELPRLWPGTGTAPAGTEPDGYRLAVDIDPVVVARLRALARTERTTLFSVLLAVFYTQLARVTGQRDLAVGSMFANRSRPELRDTVGLLANMVLLRARLGADIGVSELIRQTHAAVIGAFTYQELPFQLLQKDVVEAAGGRADDVVFNVMADLRHQVRVDDVAFELLVPEDIGSRFRFELAIAPVGVDRLRAVLFHAGGGLDHAAGQDFLAGYTAMAAGFATAPAAPIAHLLNPSVPFDPATVHPGAHL